MQGMDMNSFEVRNRHGDVVQRGVAEVRDIQTHEHPFFGEVRMATVEFHDPVELRRAGDVFETVVNLNG